MTATTADSNPKESTKEDETKKRFDFVINYFQTTNPNPTTELRFKNAYELLVATILSARCRDDTVNRVTPALFEKYPTPNDLANATEDDIYSLISSVTFANNKSNYLSRMADMLVKNFNGEVPKSESELQRLPGVGRKTANVIMATLYAKPVIAVDTHVMRVSQRLGLVTSSDSPLDIEQQLRKYTPKDVMSKMSHWLILHGRYVCVAKSPRCLPCKINDVCKYFKDSRYQISK